MEKTDGHLTFFNYVTGIALGSIAAEVIVNNQITVTRGMATLVLWSFLTFLTAEIQSDGSLHTDKRTDLL
ncbi:hypothetical protein J2TS4_58800 [Paenibacillus sp. J2TS4]|nr:hypothetical protein J2TS4_58800 [Paenibacillus sp. J2TS4]